MSEIIDEAYQTEIYAGFKGNCLFIENEKHALKLGNIYSYGKN